MWGVPGIRDSHFMLYLTALWASFMASMALTVSLRVTYRRK